MKRASNLMKAEIREAIAGIDSELAKLERTHGENVDMGRGPATTIRFRSSMMVPKSCFSPPAT